MTNITADGRIHYSHWADQPTVLIACGLIADPWEVLYPDKETLYCPAEACGYTFDRKKVTCKDCKKYIKDNPIKSYHSSWKYIIRRLLCFHKWKTTGFDNCIRICIKCRKVISMDRPRYKP